MNYIKGTDTATVITKSHPYYVQGNKTLNVLRTETISGSNGLKNKDDEKAWVILTKIYLFQV